MTTYTERPWTKLYREGWPADITPDYPTMLDVFNASVRRAPDAVAINYFDGVLTMADLDARSDSLAVALTDSGFAAGDRLGVYVQNNPAFVIALLAAWKAGGATVVINPMNKGRELKYLLTDSGASALLCLDDLYESVAKEVIATGETAVRTVITCSPLDGQSRNDERLFAGVKRLRPEGTLDLEEIFSKNDGRKPAPSIRVPTTWPCCATPRGPLGCRRGRCAPTARWCSIPRRTGTGWASAPRTPCSGSRRCSISPA